MQYLQVYLFFTLCKRKILWSLLFVKFKFNRPGRKNHKMFLNKIISWFWNLCNAKLIIANIIVVVACINFGLQNNKSTSNRTVVELVLHLQEKNKNNWINCDWVHFAFRRLNKLLISASFTHLLYGVVAVLNLQISSYSSTRGDK